MSALPSELDTWRAAHEGQVDANGVGTDVPADASPQAPPSVEPGSRIRRSWLTAGALVSLLATLVAVAVWQGGLPFPRPGGEPADWAASIDTLQVVDDSGRLLWSKTFEDMLETTAYDAAARVRSPGRLVQIRDIDGDGHREVLFLQVAFGAHRSGKLSRLWCFDRFGRLRFEHHPSRSVTFGDRSFGPPWVANRLVVTGSAAKPAIWATWIHPTGEFPTLVERVSPGGLVQSEYWSAGFVDTIVEAVVRGRPSVLVGAANNDTKGASLAVFDRERVRGSAPAMSLDKTCRNCPPGSPASFLVFPQLEMKRAIEGCGAVQGIRILGDGLRIEVEQGAAAAAGTPVEGGVVFYDFTADLSPVGAEFSEQYVALHRLWEARRLLGHPLNDADRRAVWPILSWDGTRFQKLSGPPAR